MNQHAYRIIFNASRGQWMAVAETASAHGKAAKSSRKTRRAARRLAGLAAFCTLAFATNIANAQIVANPAAPGTQQATVLQSANGVPLVNIQTPNAQGVSMNRYSQFDVQANGAILNNSRQPANTQLAGWVQGNPWLAAGSAGIIVNQIDSSQPSLLHGYTEVAGQSASVVIANPAGISVSGGGFINANGVTLTTGTLQWAGNGSLAGYSVRDGNISVTGQGLDLSGSNYAHLLARAVSINAGIWAKDLRIVTGSNTVSADGSNIKHGSAPQSSLPQGGAPVFALDVGQLGGMYAGKIFLVGTEAGLGVSNAGAIVADSAALTLSVDGQLRNSGTIAAMGATTSALNSVALIAQRVDNRNGVIVTKGDLAITSTAADGIGMENSAGQVYAAGHMALDAGNTSIVNRAGSLLADQNLTLQSGGVLDNTNGQLYAGANMAIVDSLIAAGAAQHLAEQDIINHAGSIHANQTLHINSHSLSNSGNIEAVGDLNAVLASDYAQGTSGKLAANGQLSLTSLGSVHNLGQIVGGSSATINASSQVDNQAGATIAAAGATHIQAGAALSNRGVIDGSNTHIQAPTLNNLGTGRIYGDHLVLSVDTLNNTAEGSNSAVIAARGDLDLAAREVNNSGGASLISLQNMRVGGALDSAGQAIGQAGRINNAGSFIQSGGDMSLAAETINNSNPDLRITPQVLVASHDGNNLYQVPGQMPEDASGLVMVYRGNIYPYVFGGSQSRAPDTRLVRPVHPELFGTFIDQAVINNSVCTGFGSSRTCTDNYSYATANSPLWAQFNMTPPVNYRTSEPTPTEFGAVKNIFLDTYRWNTPQDKANYDAAVANYQATLAALTVLDNAITAQNKANNAVTGGWRDYTQITGVTHSTYEDQVAASTPGQISAGGNLHLNGTLNNTDSSIVAAGNITVVGGAVNNLATQGQRAEVTDGTADYVSWRHSGGMFSCDCDIANHSYASFTHTVSSTFALPTLTYAAQQAVGAVGAIATNGSAGLSVGAAGSGFTLPSSSLYAINTANPNAPLIETDPAFTNRGLWLSSDYMLQQLGADPSSIHRRLGDGYYEQQLLLQQIGQLAGGRLLGDYSSVDAQYQALMNAGITLAQTQPLRVGVALTAEQIATLTSDIIWLVNQTITLPDGSEQTVLVPKLYAVAQNGDLAPSGALLAAGGSLHISSAGDVRSTGDLAARRVLQIDADNIFATNGRTTAQQIGLTAQRDIQVIGASVQAAQTLLAQAGGGITVRSTTASRQGGTAQNGYSNTNIDRVASLSVTGQGSGQGSTSAANTAQDGLLVLSAAGNTQLQGAHISNQAKGGVTAIQTGGDLDLGSIQTHSAQNINYGGGSHLNFASSAEVGTQIQTQGDLALQAGGSITARAAQVDAKGDLKAQSGGSIAIAAGSASQSVDDRYYRKDSGFLSSSSSTIEDQVQHSTAQASSLGGNTVTVAAGQNITVTGSQIISDQGTTLLAQNHITIEAATNTTTAHSFRESKSSGVFSSGGADITIGKQQQSLNQQGSSTSAAASTVGSIAGNTTIVAGEQYTQTGSDVISPKGDVTIVAKTITIEEARETGQQSTEHKFKQSGLTVAVGSPVISAIQTTNQMSQAAGNTSDGRMQALAAANAGLALKDAAQAVQTGQQTQGASTADKLGGISVSVSLGSSKSQSTNKSQSNTARGSSVQAGGDITIVATGAGQASDLTIQGSDISAGKTATLAADGNIALLAAQNTASQTSANSSSSGSIGVSFNLGAQTGVSVGVSASKGKGSANGSDTTYTNTHINAGDKVSIQSGADTTLKGAVVTAPQVQAQIGGNLAIESLQDSSDYHSQQSNKGISLSVPIAGTGSASGSISAGKANIHSDYQSTTEQSAIRAGDGGFQISTTGNTTLIGGQITSTQKAIDDNKNSFATGGTLTTQDLHNTADYSAKAVGVQLGTSVNHTGQYQPSGTSAGVGKDSGSASSTTTAGISGVTESGNPQVRTGDAQTGLANTFDAGKVQADINAQVQITQAFGQQAASAIGSLAKEKLEEAANKQIAAQIKTLQADAAERSGDVEQANQLRTEAQMLNEEAANFRELWGETGSARIGLHALAAGLSGGIEGASGTLASTLALPQVQAQLEQLNLPDVVKQTVLEAAALGIGAAAGNSAGAAGAFNEAANNYLTSTQEMAKDKDLAGCKTLACSASVNLKYALISGQQNIGIAVGVGAGMGYQSADMISAIVDLVKNGPETWAALSAIVNDPQFRAQVGNAIADDYQHRINLQVQAYNDGGWDGSVTAGAEAGRLALDVVTAATGAIGTGKLAVVAGKAGSELAITAVTKTSVLAAEYIQGLALKGLKVGNIYGFKSADEVNALMTSADWAPAWRPGTVVTEATIQPGARVQMVVNENTWNLIQQGKLEKVYGGWATFDDVATQAYARNQLAITPDMKLNVGYVIEVEITRPTNAYIGIVGEQATAAGGGNQVHFIVPLAERGNVFKVVGGKALP